MNYRRLVTEYCTGRTAIDLNDLVLFMVTHRQSYYCRSLRSHAQLCGIILRELGYVKRRIRDGETRNYLFELSS